MNYFPVKHIKHLLAHRNFYLWLAELWTLLIIVLCMVSFKKLPTLGIPSADKYVHFTFHFVFTVLWYVYLKKRNPQSKRLLLKVFLASLVFGIVIEICQSLFTTTRIGDIYDVMANTSGSLVSVITIIFYADYIRRNKLIK